jgi:radical SAM-linked protein
MRFRKEGAARYISHLDTMRTLQRALLRAGAQPRHTEGFNPHPVLALALPLSVGQESECELADFETAGDAIPDVGALNAALPTGLIAVRLYAPARRVGEIRWLRVRGELEYDGGAPAVAPDALDGYFHAKSVIITKRTKRGAAETDIIPMLRAVKFEQTAATAVRLDAVIAAQNPTMNPSVFLAALEAHRPELKPDFARFRRLELYDGEMRIFE